jgi:hypothetical protein
MNVLSTLKQHGDSVMAIENSPVRPNLQRTLPAGRKRGLQLAGREAAKQFEFDSIQSALGMQEPEIWNSGVHRGG